MAYTTQGYSTSNKYVAFPYKAANELLLFEKLLSFCLSRALSVPKQSLRPRSSLCGWKSQLLQQQVHLSVLPECLRIVSPSSSGSLDNGIHFRLPPVYSHCFSPKPADVKAN